MDNQKLMDRTYNIILTNIVQAGQAPHYTEIASALGVSMEEGRKILHELFSQGMAAWLFPLYMFLISLFVIPVAIAGINSGLGGKLLQKLNDKKLTQAGVQLIRSKDRLFPGVY